MNKTRFSRKCETVFWLIIYLLPVIVYITISFRNGEAQEFFNFIEAFSPFSFVQETLDSVTETAFNTTFRLNSYLAYIVGVEIFKCIFNVFIFIPKLANSWISKAVQE